MNLDALMLELRKDYIEDIPNKIQHIIDEQKAGQFTEVRMIFHKMKGSGSTYGIPEMTQLGGLLEKIANSEEMNRFVPLAISLLSRIHKSRVRSEAVNLDEDPEFEQLRQLVKSL